MTLLSKPFFSKGFNLKISSLQQAEIFLRLPSEQKGNISETIHTQITLTISAMLRGIRNESL